MTTQLQTASAEWITQMALKLVAHEIKYTSLKATLRKSNYVRNRWSKQLHDEKL